MKTSLFISTMIIVITVLIIAGSFATGQDAYMVKEDEELFGTWINTEYDETLLMSKVVIEPDGSWDEYKMSSGDEKYFKCEYTVKEKWTDSDGNTLYKIIIKSIGSDYVPYYVISKINKTGDVYEDLVSNLDMPEEFDPDDMLLHYRIYYRQK